ncbi:pantoate--beta-alanine ligase [Niabella ginsenosidivorans]|uniref:Pantothenate synthetase n=1 Tax=Niabella ginsenosidivorans TaxID=1176587 RepID=A0A1A9I0T6_9BACT|nr:pantoate--beta-alanine ligase [Niabella ginsenosidivorans]ANH81236.1 pantoate--beta-alanine ligase [Niabella ginsenosidivorans]
MILFKKKDDIQQFIAVLHKKNKKIGFVPTMGALHMGHISLIQAARKKCDLVVCSIFVNPTQFNDKKDLEKYPRTIEKDIDLLIKNDCDVLFYPDEATIYPEGTGMRKQFQLGAIESVLEGKYRPGHFQGVADVVSRLFEIIKPDEVFFGQKDLQQTRVIAHLINNTPDFKKIRMNIVSTLREPGMLAMSSRNTRLTPEQLEKAPAIYKALRFLKKHIAKGDLTSLLNAATKQLTEKGFRPEYVTIVKSETLEAVDNWDGHTPLTGLVAAFLGEVRLIDNLELTD